MKGAVQALAYIFYVVRTLMCLNLFPKIFFSSLLIRFFLIRFISLVAICFANI